MEGFDNKPHQDQHNAAGIADPSINPSNASQSTSSKGTSVQDANLDEALNQSLGGDTSNGKNGFSFAKNTASKFDSIDDAVDGISKSILSGKVDFDQAASTVEGLRQRLKNLAKEQDDSGEAAIFQQLRGDLNQVRRALVGNNADDAQEFTKLTLKAFDAADKELSGVATGAFERNPDAKRLEQLGVNIDNFDFFKGKDSGSSGSGSSQDTDKPETGSDDDHNHAGDAGKGGSDDHNHAGDNVGKPEFHISLDDVANARDLDASKVKLDRSLKDNVGKKGDILDSGAGGDDVVIGSGANDVIFGFGGGLNTITTGTGRDTILVGSETTNRIFDFDPSKDKITFTEDVNLDNIVIAQGKNPGKAGVNQPIDSNNNALIIDKDGGHILAALTFTKAADLSEKNFQQLAPDALETLDEVNANVKQDNGTLTGDGKKSDKLVGGSGNDFLYVGDNGFKFNTAKGIDEFPFPTDSDSTGEIEAKLSNGKLTLNGEFRDFDGAPLFSQGETTIDPNAKILNGSDPKALVDGFLKVPKDVEGNKISGTHLHFSPAGDSRGNFADATVIRFLENSVNEDGKSGTLKGEFELTPQEQAALLAGNLYVNVHSNVDVDGDGKAGFPTGELRINLNKDVVKFTA